MSISFLEPPENNNGIGLSDENAFFLEASSAEQAQNLFDFLSISYSWDTRLELIHRIGAKVYLKIPYYMWKKLGADNTDFIAPSVSSEVLSKSRECIRGKYKEWIDKRNY